MEECPKPLQPLAELQYRGVIFSHKNGRDWTIAGFLQSADGGRGIAAGTDTSTREAMQRALLKLQDVPEAEARQAIAILEDRHAQRRQWVWAKLGQAPLALALKHLVMLAYVSEKPLGGLTVETVATAYAEWGWQVDAAVLDALAAVENAGDVAAIKAAILPVYRPWLESAAKALQQVAIPNSKQDYVVTALPPAEPGSCVLFCDALRFDFGQRLATALERRGLACQTSWRLAPLPPVTSTAKPAVSPVAGKIAGQGKHDLVPVSVESGTNVIVTVLRSLLEGAGFQVLHGDALGDPVGKAWTEFGAIDRYGHDHGWKIAHHAIGEVAGLADRIEALLQHGWTQVLVVTDHGWLLLPNGLPKVDLPRHLAQLRKGRCAVLKDGAVTDQQTVPWHWDHDVHIAVASGIRCYEAGKEYEHGGISPQECVVPLIQVTTALPAHSGRA